MKSTKARLEEAHDREHVARRVLREWAIAFASAEEDTKNGVAAEASLCLAAGTFTNARHARKRLEKKAREEQATAEADRLKLRGDIRRDFIAKGGSR